MSKTPTLTTVQRTAAQVLAAAALEQFPGTLLLGGMGSSHGFQYDFIFPFPFQKEFLPLLEEKMRAIIKERRSIEMKEMMPKNAAAFFQHHGQPCLAECAQDSEGPLVQIFYMDKFKGLCTPPYLGSTKDLDVFILTEIKRLSKEGVRIYGNAFFDKKSLKEYSKRLKRYAETSHVVLGKEMGLFSEYREGLWVWHSKGEKVRMQLVALWRKQLEPENFNFLFAPLCQTKEERFHLHQLFAPKTAQIALLAHQEAEPEGMFATKGYTEALGCISYGEGNLIQESISSLQSITKISKILGLDYQVVLCIGSGRPSAQWKKTTQALENALKQESLEYVYDEEKALHSGPRIEWRLKDGLGREWTGPYFEVYIEKKYLIRSQYGSLERLIAVLLEQKAGILPFCLVPEHVRIFAISKAAVAFAKECCLQLKSAGFVARLDEQDSALGARLHIALREKVPYCIFIGDNELKTGRLTVRAYGAAEEKSGIEEFIKTMEDRFENK